MNELLYAIASGVGAIITFELLRPKIEALYDRFGQVLVLICFLVIGMGFIIAFFSHVITGSRILGIIVGSHLMVLGASTRKYLFMRPR